MCAEIKHCSITKNEVYNIIYLASHAGAYTSYLRGKRCQTEDLFFREISASFQFPDYYGENWAATDECLCDLEWLAFSKIFVVIDDFSCMFSGQEHIQNILQNRVIKYLTIMVEYWKEQDIPVEVLLNN